MLFPHSEVSAMVDQQMKQRQGRVASVPGMVATSIKCLKVAHQVRARCGGGVTRAVPMLPTGGPRYLSVLVSWPCLPRQGAPTSSVAASSELSACTKPAKPRHELETPDLSPAPTPSASRMEPISSLVPACSLPFPIFSRRLVFPCALHSLSTYSSK